MSTLKDTEKFVKAVENEDLAKSKDLLEDILKKKCSEKIAKTLKDIK